MKKLLPLLLCFAVLPALGYELNGVKLGGRELDVKKAFPSAHCKALEWRTDAANRRCDDARVALGGVLTKITATPRTCRKWRRRCARAGACRSPKRPK